MYIYMCVCVFSLLPVKQKMLKCTKTGIMISFLDKHEREAIKFELCGIS